MGSSSSTRKQAQKTTLKVVISPAVKRSTAGNNDNNENNSPKQPQTTLDTGSGDRKNNGNPGTKSADKHTTSNQTGSGKGSSEAMAWRQVLEQVANLELWDGQNREERPEWREYLKRADDIVRKPRKTIPADVVMTILEGDMVTLDMSKVPNAQPKVVVFVSSTFTDTKAERNHLMKDVYPYLRSVCRRLGIDFGTVDMRWGVTEEATMDHSTVDMCVSEIERCIKESCGPAFLCLLSHKYGYRPLPAAIDQLEFETLVKHLVKSGTDTSLISSYYRLDKNALPTEYVLKPRSPDNSSWWDDVEEIQELFRTASVACFGDGSKKCDKYHISVTETEIHNGAFNNPNAYQQVSFIERDLKNITSDTHRDRKLCDMKQGTLDEYAQGKLKELREKKIPTVETRDKLLSMEYDVNSPASCGEYVKVVCNTVCKNLVENILENYESRLHVEDDAIFSEALQQRAHAQDKASLFVGREKELQGIQQYVVSKHRNPLVVHGRSGCGKTAFMAVSAKNIKHMVKNCVVILRFLGTTDRSGSARALLQSVCTQITRAYGHDISTIPSSYKELIKHFKTCMEYAPTNKPLIIILDSLDQLSNEDLGQNLAWLSLAEELPVNCKLIVSTLPTQCLEILKGNLQDEDLFIEIQALKMNEGPEILTKMLNMRQRTVTDGQKKIIMESFAKCPLPLFLRLVVDIASTWHSYDEVLSADIADDMQGLINRLFERLESRYGSMFVHHALAYITASKQGLSLGELEDILSCDDEVLDGIFKWWTPPVRRIPPLLWARVRNELGGYLQERGTDGVSAYAWYHRQFWETAEKRYLQNPMEGESTPFLQTAHVAIADYFEGKWQNGKPHKKPKDGANAAPKMEDRKLPKQPIIVSGDRRTSRKLNKRKLSELPYHFIQTRDWERFQKLVLNLEYIEAKFEADDGYNCFSEIIEATKLSGINVIKELTRFVGSNMAFLIREPDAVYQVASQQSQKSSIRKLLSSIDLGSIPFPLTKNMAEQDFDDPCEMTLQGHTEAILCCDYSPKGDLIVSTAHDGSMRIWDTTTGAELVTISSLPLPVWPTKDDEQQLIIHPVNPCCFSRSGETIVCGTEHGNVILWDTTGVQLQSSKLSDCSVGAIGFSPDNKLVAAAFKNSVVSFWNAEDLSHVTTMNLGWDELTGLDFSPDGKLLAIMCITGLVLVDVSQYKVVSQNRGVASLGLCCTFHPSGQQVMTGGSDSCVSVWSTSSGTVVSSCKAHNAWIWTVKFTKDGNHMFTGSSDRSMKVWKWTGGNWSVLATIGGHSHRVSWVALEHGLERKLVTSALDKSLKVWDVQALLQGNTPPVGGMHYNVCVVSPNSKYFATSQGWMHNCNLFDARTLTSIGMSANHTGFVKMAKFTRDDARFVTLDYGHSGTYDAGSEKNACISVMAMETMSTVCARLDVTSPTAIDVGTKYIVVGTFTSTIHLFDVDTYQQVNMWRSGNTEQITDVAVSPVSNRIAACCGKACIVWDASEGHLNHIKDLPEHDVEITICEFSPDGRYLTVGTGSGKMYVWNTSDDNIPLVDIVLNHDGSYIKDIKYSPNGKYIVTSAGLVMRIWHAEGKMSLACTYYAPVNYASFLNNGQETSLSIMLAGEATGNLKCIAFQK